MKIKAIITGSTGMVGKAVLIECLESEDVESVLVINRRSLHMSHPKLTEIIHSDLSDIGLIEKDLAGYNACFFCIKIQMLPLCHRD